MLFFDNRTKQQVAAETTLQKVAQSDKRAVRDCVNTYGDLIWSLVREKTSSLEEAERMTLEIFNDVWEYAEQFDPTKFNEMTFISFLVHRRLVIH